MLMTINALSLHVAEHSTFYSSINNHQSCFHLLAITNDGAMNIYAQVSWGHPFSPLLVTYLGEELPGQMVTPHLTI